MYLLQGWWLIVVWLLCSAVSAAPVILSDSDTQAIFPELSMLEDPGGNLTLADVITEPYASRFISVGNTRLQRSQLDPVVWVRFEVQQQGEGRWLLLTGTGNDVNATLYAVPLAASGAIDQLLTQSQSRKTDFLTPVFAPTLVRGLNYQIFLRIDNYYSSLSLQLQWLPESQVLQQKQPDVLFTGLIVGGILSLAVYNLFLFFSFREFSYLILVIFVTALALELSFFSGTLRLFIRSEAWLQLLRPVSGAVAIMSGLGFFRIFIQSRHLAPRRDKLLLLLIGVAGSTLIVSPWMPIATSLYGVLGLVSLPLVVLLTIQASAQGYQTARNFIYALVVLFMGVLPALLVSVELIPMSPYVGYFMHLGFLGFALLFSLIQVERTRTLRENSERAHAASLAKTEFLTTMSHELRTPMNAVVGIGELMRQTPLNLEQQDYINKLEVSSRHMMQLIDDILDFSRIEQRKLDLVHKPFQLTTLLDGIGQILQSQAQHKGLSFKCETDLTDEDRLVGDATRLSQVLLNLCVNAIKFTKTGQVVLSVRQLSEPEEESLTVLFEVTDTGVGVSKEQLNRLFQPFTQINTEAMQQQKQSGFGLGLSISRRLVEAMSGELLVDSVQGHGSRFYFTLNFVRQDAFLAGDITTDKSEAEVLPEQQPPTEEVKKAHVLLVDDDELNRFLGAKMLSVLGHRVTVAESGSMALKQLQKYTFDLVFMDVSMPEMDGYEATRQLRAMGHHRLPVVALTAHAVKGERERCLAAGMNDFFTKPFELRDLERMVDLYLRESPRSDFHAGGVYPTCELP